MTDSTQQSDIDKLREFETRMQAEGAAGFADGLEPWNNWQESATEEINTVWESIRQRENMTTGKTLCEKLLSSMAVLAVATLAVGIGGVYLSTKQTPQIASNAIQPLPIHDPTVSMVTPPLSGTVIRQTDQTQEMPLTESATAELTGETGSTLDETGQTPVADTAGTDTAEDSSLLSGYLAAAPADTAYKADLAEELPAPAAGTAETTVSMIAQPETTSVTMPLADITATTAGSGDGVWVVNISSYSFESMARRKLEEFRQKGVTAEIHPVMVNDKQMYRIRATGYETREEANTWVSLLQDRLGVSSAWVSKR